MEEFHNSLPVDRRLMEVDIDASIAWAKGLQKAKILSEKRI